jgi:glycine cleavage system protein P-like pyridoxal-binding family
LMVTYPSTWCFESAIKEHNWFTIMVDKYMDGANMNAQVGLTNPKQLVLMFVT